MSFINIGDHVVNLEMVSAAHWENDKLFLHLSGGRWITFADDAAKAIWQALKEAINDGAAIPQRDRAAGLGKAGGNPSACGNPQPHLELHNAGAE